MKRLVISLILVLFLVSLVSAGWWTGKVVSVNNGHSSFCNPKYSGYPCGAGEGDCDKSTECATGYCANNVGKKYGMPSSYDVCECASGKVWDVTSKTCVTPAIVTCNDSDGGLNYGVKGSSFEDHLNEADKNHTETCKNNEIIYESYCERGLTKVVEYNCSSEGKVCQDGACVTSIPSCVPKTCLQLSKNCGSVNDGCGGSLSCGTCSGGKTCSNGNCVTSASGTFVVGKIYDKTIGSNNYKMSVNGTSTSKWGTGTTTVSIFYSNMSLASWVTLNSGDLKNFSKLPISVKASGFGYKTSGSTRTFYSVYLDLNEVICASGKVWKNGGCVELPKIACYTHTDCGVTGSIILKQKYCDRSFLCTNGTFKMTYTCFNSGTPSSYCKTTEVMINSGSCWNCGSIGKVCSDGTCVA